MTDLHNAGRGRQPLASFASFAETSRGRLLSEPASATRSDFQRDRDRIIHSDAFRRLKHKTQVFVHHEGDHFRTRLTHTIEVGQIARALARALRVDEDLAEALALVHDFGHTPFGHAGERVLAEKMEPYGGFEHNAQSLRIVTQLERRYARFDGLNLTWETLEGLVKHNGPLVDEDGDGLEHPLPATIREYNQRHDLWLWSWPSVEAQCAALADDIAYDNHDIDDALRAGLLTLDDLAAVPLCADILRTIHNEFPDLDAKRMGHELVRRQITKMVEDVIIESAGRLQDAAPQTSDDIRRLDTAVVSFSTQMEIWEKQIKAFMFEHVYRSREVMKPVEAAEQIVADLFDFYMEEEGALPDSEEWNVTGKSPQNRARTIADYIAGMTDRFARREYQRIFDRTHDVG